MARLRGSSWQGSLKTPEKYHRFSFPTETLAEAWESLAKEAFRAGLPIPTPTTVEGDRPTLSQFYKTHRDVIWNGTMFRNSDANQRAVEVRLGSTLKIQQITPMKLQELASAMIRAGNTPSTINTRLSHINVLLLHAKRCGLVDNVPPMVWQKKHVDNSRMKFLTESEEQALLGLLRHWGYTCEAELMMALVDTGCRPSELIHGESRGAPLKWSEVSVSAGGTAPDVNDPATGKPKAVLSLMRTKTGKYRVLPLTDRARDAFKASAGRGDIRPFGKLRTGDMSAIIRQAADHLSMPDVVLYTMRHTCASRLVQRGADIRRVMQWMGHTNINTTMRYAKLTPTDIFAIGDLL